VVCWWNLLTKTVSGFRGVGALRRQSEGLASLPLSYFEAFLYFGYRSHLTHQQLSTNWLKISKYFKFQIFLNFSGVYDVMQSTIGK